MGRHVICDESLGQKFLNCSFHYTLGGKALGGLHKRSINNRTDYREKIGVQAWFRGQSGISKEFYRCAFEYAWDTWNLISYCILQSVWRAWLSGPDSRRQTFLWHSPIGQAIEGAVTLRCLDRCGTSSSVASNNWGAIGRSPIGVEVLNVAVIWLLSRSMRPGLFGHGSVFIVIASVGFYYSRSRRRGSVERRLKSNCWNKCNENLATKEGDRRAKF